MSSRHNLWAVAIRSSLRVRHPQRVGALEMWRPGHSRRVHRFGGLGLAGYRPRRPPRGLTLRLALFFFVVGAVAGWYAGRLQAVPERPGVELSVYRHDIGKTVTMELEEYVKGVVAAEMPIGFHLEALKAQAVAARTLAL